MSYPCSVADAKATIKSLEVNSQANVPVTNLNSALPNGGVRSSSNKATKGVESKFDAAEARKK
jgi:hypothetical protein